ncbi:hypothetical protein Peur_011250 [Populus x canadensis]
MGNTRTDVKRDLQNIQRRGRLRQALHGNKELVGQLAKAIVLYQNSDCVELYIHNLLSCILVVNEAIEISGEFSGLDHDEIQKKRLELCNRYDTVWKEDRWMLLNKILEKKMSGSTKQEGHLTDILLKNLEGLEPVNGKLLPCSILLRSKDYQIKRHLGSGSQ